MLFLCMLYVKVTVPCFILVVTNYEPLVYHILLVCYAQSAFKMYLFLKSWCHSIYIYDNDVFLSGLPNFISMHLFYMYFHTYAFYQVSCVIYYRVYYYYFDRTVYGISQQSSILHISFYYHPKILVLKIGWSSINCKDFICIGKAFGLPVYRLLIPRCDPITFKKWFISL